jgi:hypothetical protein
MGRDFFPAFAAIMHWGDRWLDDGSGPPIMLLHKDCGHSTYAEVQCAHCHGAFTSEQVTMKAAP